MATKRLRRPFIQIGFRRPFVKLSSGDWVPAIVTIAETVYAKKKTPSGKIALRRKSVFIDLWLFSVIFNRYER